MKLIHKTTRYLAVVTIPIALAGAVLLYYLIHQVINKEIDELLSSELKQVQENLDRHPPGTGGLLNWDHNLQITPARVAGSQPPVFTDTTLLDPIENKVVSVRMLRAVYPVGKDYYVIRLHQPYLEFQEIAQYLSIGIVLCFIALFAILLFIGTLLFRRVLQPFYTIIERLSQYRIDQHAAITFPASDVDEFRLLGQSITEMTQQAAYRYSQQKQFTDTTSHELQTPLSILSTDLDLLQQSAGLTEADSQRIHRSQRTIKRLSSMNQSLLLLTKIDNQQFLQVEPVDLGNLIGVLLDTFSDYAASKHMTFERSDQQKPVVVINRQLAFILLSNLIRNAIRHGRPASSIGIASGAHYYAIRNQGEPLPFPSEKLFQRFVRNPALPQSTGLGLAIVKEIADQSGLRVDHTYSASAGEHTFTITFQPAQG
jgi:signal transduction histidine kinase